MGDRATRPLNKNAVKAADNDLYQNHANDPRPNALYDADGNRKPLNANDPDQADLRKEWMDSYKANGGETEQSDDSGQTADQMIIDCDQRQQVNPLIIGHPVELDESDDGIEDEPDPEEEPEEPEPEDTSEEEAEEPAETS